MGFFKDLIDDVTGKTDKKAAQAQAAGRQDAQQQLENFIGEFARPAAEQQRGAQNLLADFLGVTSPEAQARAFQSFQNDPGFQASLDAGTRAIDQGASAGGQLNSGGRQKALFRFGQQAQNQQFTNRLAQLASFQPGAQNALLTATGARNNQRIGVGDATAQGIIGGANARTGFANQIIQLGGRLAGSFTGSGFGGSGAGAGSGSGSAARF